MACRADLGTGDEIGIDIFINMMRGFSKEVLGIKQLCIGGVNDDWPTDSEPLQVQMPCVFQRAMPFGI